MMIYGVILAIVYLLGTVHGNGHGGCQMTDTVCEFWLKVERKLTMMAGKYAVFPYDGKLYKYDVTNTSAAQPISMDTVITADGWEDSRAVVSVNGSMPGPPIEVFEGQTVKVNIMNALDNEGVTIHWHGLHLPETPWMDGVAFVTQCPILPGQTFTYKFKAEPKGTFWYHSHIGSQRTQGLFGPFIIREKKPMQMKEFLFTVQEWNHDFGAELQTLKMNFGYYINRKKFQTSKSLDGSNFSNFGMQSGLVNGKGRFYYKNGTHNGAPLETFEVEQNQSYKFRVIAAGALYPFRISIDNHNLSVVASDGYDLKPIEAESFIINPGERYDFVIQADQNIGNYWIRCNTLEINRNHSAEAILRYKGATDMDPTSTQKNCSRSDPCLVVNCPFTYYPVMDYTNCMTFDELKSLKDDATPNAPNIDEFFLNFAFPGQGWTPGSVNGIAFRNPTISALTQPKAFRTDCNDHDCGEQKVCRCKKSMDLQHGRVIQMVFMNMGQGKGWAHPVHLHGHSFYVVKMGYGKYNETTGKIMADNMDINCRKSFCNNATWRNSSWLGGNVPGLEMKNAPRKDTIIVPSGGYVVIRFKADNPGLWFIHCHIEMHANDGMALMINESFSQQPPPPTHFPVCHNFDDAMSMSQPSPTSPPQTGTTSKMPSVAGADPYTDKIYSIVIACIVGIAIIIILQFIIMMCLYTKRKEGSKNKYSPSKPRDNMGFDSN